MFDHTPAPSPDSDPLKDSSIERPAPTHAQWEDEMQAALALLTHGQHAEAIASSLRAVEMAERLFLPGDLRRSNSYETAASACMAGGKLAIAEDMLQRSIDNRGKLVYEDRMLPLLYNQLADCRMYLNDKAGALAAMERSVDLKSKLGRTPVDEVTDALQLSSLHSINGNAAEAGRLMIEAYSALHRLAPADRVSVIGALASVGSLKMLDGAYQDAELLIGDALRFMTEAGGKGPIVANFHEQIAVAQSQQGKHDRAIDSLKSALEIHEALQGAIGPGARQIRSQIAHLQTEKGEPIKGEKTLRTLVSQMKETESESLEDRRALAGALLEVAASCHASTKIIEAEEAAGEAQRLVEGELCHEAAMAEDALGDVAMAKRNLEEAEERFRSALGIRARLSELPASDRRHLGTDHPYFGSSHLRIANICVLTDRIPEAEDELDEAERNFENVPKSMKHNGEAHALHIRGKIAELRGDTAEAEELFDSSLREQRKQANGRDTYHAVPIMIEIANLYADTSRPEEAVEMLEKARDVMGKAARSSSIPAFAAATRLAELYGELGESDKSEALSCEAQATANELSWLNDGLVFDDLLGPEF